MINLNDQLNMFWEFNFEKNSYVGKMFLKESRDNAMPEKFKHSGQGEK
jgi:hypothetical protein